MGEWQTRAQVSTLLVPKAARTSFWTRKVSSFVQREEVMPPIESLPYLAWMRLNSDGRVVEGLVPAHFAPFVGDALADHGLA